MPAVIEAVLTFFESRPVKKWDAGAVVNEIAYALAPCVSVVAAST